MATLHWLKIMMSLGFSNMVIKEEALSVIHAITRKGYDRASFGHLIVDIKTLAQLLHVHGLTHTFREGHVVAHF